MVDYDRHLPASQQAFSRRKRVSQFLHLDLLLLTPLLILMIGGLVVLYSGSDGDMATVMRQVRNQIVGLIAMLCAAQIRLDTYRRWAPALFFAGVLLLVLVPLVGVSAMGAQRWLSLGIVRFQPSELMKLAMPLMVLCGLLGMPFLPGLPHFLGRSAW